MYLPEGIARPGPGEYLPDPTEGITRIEDLPKPKILRRSHVTGDSRAPRCGHSAYYNRQVHRLPHNLGDLVSGRPPRYPPDLRAAFLLHSSGPMYHNRLPSWSGSS